MWGVVAILLAFLVGCGTAPKTDRTDRLRQEIEEEVAVGKMMAQRLAGFYGTYFEDKKALHYINMVGQTLLRKSGRPEIKYYFGILNTDEINAFATPGGYIFVTKGLLKQVRSEDELAGILGHEIAHINEKHMYNQISEKREVGGSETFVRLLSRGGSQMGAAVGKMVNKGLDILIEEGLGKEKEFEADWAGSMYVVASGYDPQGLLHYIKRVSQSLAEVKVAKTHPPFDERISAFKNFLKENGLTGGSSNAHLKPRFAKNMKGLIKERSHEN